MKVIQASFSHSLGGMEKYMIELSRQLLKKNVEVVALCRRDTMLERALFSEKIPYFSLDPLDYLDPVAINRIREIIGPAPGPAGSTDIVHAHTSRDLALLIPAATLAGRPQVVFTMHMDTHCSKQDIYHHLLFRRLKRVFAITDRVKQEVIDAWPVPAERVKTIYNGIAVSDYRRQAGTPGTIRQQLTIPADCRLIGITGRLESPKGQDTFIEAAAHVLRKNDKVRFLVVGGDGLPGEPFLRSLQDRVRELKIEEQVHFTGRVASTAPYVNDLDIFVMLSHCEAFGLVLLEAMALAKPVIATDSGGVTEIIEAEQEGILVKPQDPLAAAAAMLRLLGDDELRGRLAASGEQRVKTDFELNDKIFSIMNEYNQVMQEFNANN